MPLFDFLYGSGAVLWATFLSLIFLVAGTVLILVLTVDPEKEWSDDCSRLEALRDLRSKS